MPIVPGTLIEARQLAVLACCVAHPYVKRCRIRQKAGRNCWSKSPVLPDTDVPFQIHCRQMAPLAVNAQISVTIPKPPVLTWRSLKHQQRAAGLVIRSLSGAAGPFRAGYPPAFRTTQNPRHGKRRPRV